jgi:uncharacterized membrane protein SpoIIM required for sporulation
MNTNKKNSLIRSSMLISLIIYLAGWGVGILAGLVLRSMIMPQPLGIHLRTNVSAWYYISHNLTVEAILVLSACLPFIGTGLILFGNGVFEGAVVVPIAQQYGLGSLLGGLLPHGIPETAGWVLTGTVGIILSRHLYSHLLQFFSKKSQYTHRESGELRTEPQNVFSNGRRDDSNSVQACLLIILTATLLLIIAGILEAYVSPYLALYISHL